MSNFNKKGKRNLMLKSKKEASKRLKEVYKIMDDLDEVAKDIYYAKEVVTEDNVIEIASKYTDRTIEGLEKHILLSKLEVLNGEEAKD